MTRAPHVDVEKFWKHGYTIVRCVFSPQEAEAWRQAILENPTHDGDMLSHPSPIVRQVLLDPRLIDIGQRILGCGKLVYFGDSTAKVGIFGRGYHKDNADRNDPKAPDWVGRYTLIRFGIYLQDHTRHSGGLNIRAGSHNWTDLERGRTVYMDTALGDVVIWSLRTSHSANGMLLKGPLCRIHLGPKQLRFVPESLLRPYERERVAMFFTVGLDDAHLERYLGYVKKRAYMIDIWKRSPWNPDLIAKSAGLPIELRDVWSMVRDEPDLGINKDYAAIPY
ncbi:MAG: hypothetical protein IPM54_30210 [Polyangiaceae bacterium]|nr:hypothetical protein [Polyangiaceae bacterium]